MRQWVEVEDDHRRCLYECFWAMILGCGDEEAQMQVDELRERYSYSFGPQFAILVREEEISEEEGEQESNVEEAR